MAKSNPSLHLVLCVGILCSACRSGALRQHRIAFLPRQIYEQKVLEELKGNWLKDFRGLPEDSAEKVEIKVKRRNEILNEMIWLVDNSFEQFVRAFHVRTGTYNTAADAINIGLTGTSSVITPPGTKSILSAVAGGVTGIRASVDKNFFEQQSWQAIVSNMRALRATKLAEIQEHMKTKGLNDYTIEQGLIEVQEYFFAGTVTAALGSFTAQAAAQAKKAEEDQKTARQRTQVLTKESNPPTSPPGHNR